LQSVTELNIVRTLTCMPSTPLIPTPISASWIIPTSLAPSPIPRVVLPVPSLTSFVICSNYTICTQLKGPLSLCYQFCDRNQTIKIAQKTNTTCIKNNLCRELTAHLVEGVYQGLLLWGNTAADDRCTLDSQSKQILF
jgi:hypothetical protein